MKAKKETAPKPETKETGTRTSRESSSLLIGILALLFSVAAAVMLFLNVPVMVCAIFAGVGALGGFVSLLFGKSGTLPAVVAIGAGFMCILAFAVLNASVQ